MNPVLRWSVWGNSVGDELPMLRDSILSFRRYFGPSAEYIVFSDAPSKIGDQLSGLATLRTFDSLQAPAFDSDGITPWRKWCPTARWSPGSPEISIDADVFCVGPPSELLAFVQNPGKAICALQESCPEWWCYGVFHSQLAPVMPRVNAGLVAQQSGVSIHDRLAELHAWWERAVPAPQRTPHDEQGAIAVVFREHEHLGQTKLLPCDRYILLSPRSNANVASLSNYAVIHTTHPNHPYYHRFRREIAGTE